MFQRQFLGACGARVAAMALSWVVAAQAAVAQDSAPARTEPVDSPVPAAGETVPGAEQVRFRNVALMVAAVGGTAAYGKAKWWQDGFSGGFKTVNEGWFGQGTDYGGADKLGHAMSSYAGSRLLTRAFGWAGNDSATALKLGLWTSVGTLMGVEIIDGYSKKWRFSKDDAILNLAGGALAYWMETSPAADALLDVRLQYSPSHGPTGRRGFDPFGDYSGQRYLLVLKADGVPALRNQPLLRYLEFSVGYGTRNFETESRALNSPTRHVYYGVSLNLSEVLRSTVFNGSAGPSRTQRIAETLFEFVQLPGASVGGDHVIR